jgi:hypothetical protein
MPHSSQRPVRIILTDAQALQHPWFQERPLPKKPSEMPTFPSLAAGEKATTINADDFA